MGLAKLVLVQSRSTPHDAPDVALAKRNLPAYARHQHERAERMEALLQNVIVEDATMPWLSSDLKARIEKALDD